MKKYFFLFLGKTVFYLGKNWREDEMKTILPLPIENYLEHALILKVLKWKIIDKIKDFLIHVKIVTVWAIF